MGEFFRGKRRTPLSFANLILSQPDQGFSIKGGALRSKGTERYLGEFLSDMILLLHEGRAGGIEALVKKTMEKLEHHQVLIAWLAKTEALSESPDIDPYSQDEPLALIGKFKAFLPHTESVPG